MTCANIKVMLQDGLNHPIAPLFVNKANEFSCRVTLSSQGYTLNAKSLLGVLSLGVGQNEEITLTADGPGEDVAVAILAEFLQRS